jgi:hypothetical protein
MKVTDFFRKVFGARTEPDTRLLSPDGHTMWDGKTVNSSTRSSAVGMPQEGPDISVFLERLRRAAPDIRADELAYVNRYLVASAKPYLEYKASAGEWNKRLAGFRRRLETSDFKGALSIAEGMERDYPGGDESTWSRAEALAGLARWPDAASAASQRLGVRRPDVERGFMQMVAMTAMSGDRDAYRRLVRTLRIAAPNYPRLVLAVAECTVYGLTPIAAEDPVAEAVRIEKSYSTELHEHGRVILKVRFALVLARAGRIAEAEKVVRSALSDPIVAGSQRSGIELNRVVLALVLARKGDFGGARTELARAEAAVGTPLSDGALVAGLGASQQDDTENRAIYAVLRREVKALLDR